MPITSFKSEWALIKKNYEKASGKKKPSAKLAGANKSASGLEPACSDLDSAIKKGDGSAALKASEKIEAAGSVYQKAIVAAAGGEDSGIKQELMVMVGEIRELMAEAKRQAGALSDKEENAKAIDVAWTAIVKQYVATSLPNNAALKAFISSKEFGQDVITHQPNAVLADLQKKARGHLVDYVKRLGVVKTVKPSTDAKAAKAMFDTMAEANDAIALNDGLMHCLGEWRLKASGTPQATQAYNNSNLKQIMDSANDAASAENMRLGEIQRSFERQVMKRL